MPRYVCDECEYYTNSNLDAQEHESEHADNRNDNRLHAQKQEKSDG